MMAAISEGVNIRERTHNAIDSIVRDQFAQVEHHAGPTDVRYFGPQTHNPSASDVYTPFSTPWELGQNDVEETTMAQTTYDTRKGQAHPDDGVPTHIPEPRGEHAQTMAQRPFYEEFAQESASRRCSIAMQRNWNTTDDYNTIRTQTDEKFVDINFPIEDAIYWQDFGEAGGLSTLNIEWKRVSEPGFPSDNFWGDGISVRDIRQGYIGNCWIMAAMSALAEHPERVDNIMISDGLEEAGIYAMNMYSLGIPYTQIIDDRMPMRSNGQSLFAGVGQDGSFWAMIVEKMFAKWYGNWEHLVGGWMNLAVAALNGSPWVTHVHENNHDQIWNYVANADQDTDIITAASQFCGSHDSSTDAGVACSHAYTLISSHVVQDPSGNDIKLFKMRNPWGAEQYGGDWSDNWSGWTPEFQAQLPAVHEFANDGVFYIDLDSYMVNFSRTQINQDTSSWNLKWFLMRDDPADAARATTECGSATCTKHQIRITNNGADQAFHVGGHVWQDRTYAWRNASPLTAACPEMYNNPQHALYKEGSSYWSGQRFNSGAGSTWFDGEVIPAGESRVYNTVWNWDADMYSRKRDWSVTAWGVDHEDFTVEHVDGLASAHSPTYDDGQRSEPTEIEFPPPPPQTCWDSNFGAADSYGDACAGYAQNWCSGNNNGQYDTETFNSGLMCCMCGGGCDCDPAEPDCDCTNPLDDDEEDVTPTPTPDEDDEVDPDEDGDDQDQDEDDVTPTPDPEPVCYDNDENGTLYDRDGYPYNCSAYTTSPSYCGNYDDDDFVSQEICCACGGGCDCDPNDADCDCNDDGEDGDDEGEDEVDPTPEPLEPHEVAFNALDLNTNAALNATELEVFWLANCENSDCDANMTVLISIYDQNENGSICVGEFFALFNDVNAGTVEWPDIVPDEDDDMPTPDEDDEVTPTPDEQDIIDAFS